VLTAFPITAAGGLLVFISSPMVNSAGRIDDCLAAAIKTSTGDHLLLLCRTYNLSAAMSGIGSSIFCFQRLHSFAGDRLFRLGEIKNRQAVHVLDTGGSPRSSQNEFRNCLTERQVAALRISFGYRSYVIIQRDCHSHGSIV